MTQAHSQTPFLPRAPECLRDLGLPARSRLESRWTTVGGVRMHSRGTSAKSGAVPFVLVHGLVISSLYMIPLAECLAVDHEVHALDLPGFGRTDAPAEVLTIPQLAEAVVAWLEKAGIQRCHLMANSLGCQVAAHVAVTAPQRVETLVLVGPTLDPASHSMCRETGRLLRDALQEPKRLWLNWIFDFMRAGLRRALGTTGAMFRDYIEQQLPRISARTLIIRGGMDPTVPPAAALAMRALLANGELMVIEGEPHCVHYTQPEMVCRAIVALAGGLSVGAE